MNTLIYLIVILLAAIIALIFLIMKNKAFNFDIEDVVLCSEELERHAEQLAKSQVTSIRKDSIRHVIKRIEEKFQDILNTYDKLNNDASVSFPVPPAAEWLLDNFYIIEEQKNTIIKQLKEIKTAVPVISEGSYTGYPRIYAIAVEIVSHTDGNANERIIRDFITSYQKLEFLLVEELWLLTLMVKAALMEKLWVACMRLKAIRRDWYRAQEIAGRIKEYEQDCNAFKEKINGLEDLSPAFVEYLIRKLRKEGSKTLWMIECLDSILIEKSTSSDNYISLEHHNQAVAQVSMGNVVNSLRVLSGFDSTSLFESLSEVERILKQDPAGVYSKMDFNSRNYYRNTIVTLAEKHKTTEINIARLSCGLAKEAYDADDSAIQQNHVGYYLIGKGTCKLLSKLNGTAMPDISNSSDDKSGSVKIYIFTIALLTILITAVPFSICFSIVEGWSLIALIIISILGLIPASEISAAIVNSFLSRVVKPTRFPKLELKEGIPEEAATMVIVPTLIPNVKKTIELINNLEVFFLANRGKNIYFALVGDFKDSNKKIEKVDEEIVNAAISRIKQLNSMHAEGGEDIFYFFCRKRLFSQKQSKWMGWERKRGAIMEFNRLLQGSKNTSYVYASGGIERIPAIKYVITLDSDTQLPLETARQLIGTITHPLNRAVYDTSRGIITDGYGILQPRIDVSIDSTCASCFTKIFAGQGGIDPYTTTVSDVYQDTFGEGIFTGKGIYDLEIFQRTLEGTIPENTVLSHDLLEGSYLRTGLVTDIELIDGYPAKYNSFMMRLHRWTRGDWQLLPWIFGKNNLSLLSKWKMIDNLRRSLVYPCLALILLLCLSVLPSCCSAWIVLSSISICAPIISYLVYLIFVGDYKIYITKRSVTVLSGLYAIALQVGLMLSFAPYQAYLMADAIIKTTVRVLFTKRNLLEWVTAADMELALKNDLNSYYRRMWFSPVYGTIVLISGMLIHFGHILLCSGAFLLWLLAPWFAYIISKAHVSKTEELSKDRLSELKLLARKTWCYFDEFAGPEDNYLPVDNFQEEPYKGSAHRTSPTNIGLLLVSNLAARDLGYISTLDLIERISNTVDTIDRMQKWNGHLYNWYNTTNLQILRPRFISTVDSGNFAGYLMVLEEGLKQYQNRPAYDEQTVDGLFVLLELCNREEGSENPYFRIDILRKLVADSELNSNSSVSSERTSASHIYKALIPCIKKSVEEMDEELKSGYWVKKLLNTVTCFETDYQRYGESVFNILNELPEVLSDIIKLRSRIQVITDKMNFKYLYDSTRSLFSIGFDVEEGHLYKSYYDLFASEARQTSLIAIAKGEINKQHWFKLGRKLTKFEGGKGLVSWTGTMFEYLMPRLVIKSYPNTLLDKTYEFVVNTQIRYGQRNNIPWGISESCYYAFDIALNYQYRAFGVPQLGLKRGLINDLVVSPYSTIMAIDIATEECLENIEKLRRYGAEGKFGLYEALDFTTSRVQQEHSCEIVKSYMVHHQGMSMLAFDNFFNDKIMQTRFHANPIIKAVDSLLQERFPTSAIISKEHREQPLFTYRKQSGFEESVIRTYSKLEIVPKLHLLTNGSYNVMLTDRGSGFARCNSMAVYRWVNDYMVSSGAFIYIRNVNSNEYWSTTYNPVNTKPEVYRTIFSPHKAEYIRKEGNIETNTEVIVSTEDNAEIRRVSIHNHSSSKRIIELTSYMEVVLTQPESDIAHPAFSKLFVKTEYVSDYNGLLAMRRKRDDVKETIWGYHTVSTNGAVQGGIEYETDRSQFIGKSRSLAAPKAMETDMPLTNSVGPVLDPVFSLRIRVCVEPGETAVVNFCVGTCDSRQVALEMLEKYCDVGAAERVLEMAWTRSIVEAGFVNIRADDERAYLKLLPKLIFCLDRKKQAEFIKNNLLGQSELWPLGISGDVPIVLLKVMSRDDFDEVNWSLKMHDYLRLKGITFDLVLLIIDKESYMQPILNMVRDLAVSGRSCDLMDKRGGIFIRSISQMSEQQKNLLFTCAKVMVDAQEGVGNLIEEGLDSDEVKASINKQKLAKLNKSGGALSKEYKVEVSEELRPLYAIEDIGDIEEEQENELEITDTDTSPNSDTLTVFATKQVNLNEEQEISRLISELRFFNGVGGFLKDGSEYVICLKKGMTTPAPWSNIIANKNFGFICTESGGGYTWNQNSSQNKLTSWCNDPVLDSPSEIVFLSRKDSGEVWSCTPLPVRENEAYIIRHGFGYTSYAHNSHGLEQELIQFTVEDAPVKLSVLKLKNATDSEVVIDVAYYLKPVLGVEPGQTSPYIVTEFDEKLNSLLIENVYSSDFRGLKAFLTCSGEELTYTGDRLEFVGAAMDFTRPKGMTDSLSGTVGAGLDACAVVKTQLHIQPDEIKQIAFAFGQEKEDILQHLIPKYRNLVSVLKELTKVRENWNMRLRQIQVETPDEAMNILLNGWLQYQVLSSRVWARTGFYQAGGAFGFRDQLQDVMAVVYSMPEVTKQQILLHCRHQFVEGDVQHWWHDQKMNGIRTRYSDDLLWLPYVTCDYINATADYEILNSVEPFIWSNSLKENEHERYEIPSLAKETGTVYEHCIKAIEIGLRIGPHGIPLMGGGDWNDGMNLIGINGKGESVWLGWFLYCVLLKMIPVCRYMRDEDRALTYEQKAKEIIEAIEKEAWDGSWYRRAYFDDGSPLGSIQNSEGKIDSLSQSWAAISAAARSSRVEEAMDAVEKYLIDRKNGIIKLLTPPFYDSDLNPGYIKGYLPGVRENGGQYTHAATWVVYAFSSLGNGEMAWELFNMVNPINHSRTDMERMTYKVEPYVMAADVYAVYPNEGRGGWTWYTGAAGWMYRIGLEHILGIKKQGNRLLIEPCIPKGLKEYSVTYKYGGTIYRITIKNLSHENTTVKKVSVDGRISDINSFELVDDGKTHNVEAQI